MKIRKSAFLVCSASLLWAAVQATDQTVTGNLTVTGNVVVNGAIDSDSNLLSFGTQGTNPGVNLIYQDNSADTLTFYSQRNPASWLWLHNAIASGTISAMRLDANHKLFLYKADGTTTGASIDPVSGSLSLGSATLTANGTSLTTNGAMTVGGAITNGAGAITGGTNGLALNAGGAGNQNVTLVPSGSGSVVVDGMSLVLKNDSTVANGLLSQILANRETSDPSGNAAAVRFYRENGATDGAIALATNPGAATGQQPTERLRVTKNGNVGIGTANPGAKLEVAGNLKVNSYPLQGGGITGQMTVGNWGGASGAIEFWGNKGVAAPRAMIGYLLNRGAASQDFYVRSRGSHGTLSLETRGGGLFVNPGGNVGIRTINPVTRFMVADDNPNVGGITIGTGSVSDGGNLRLLSNVNHWNFDNFGGNLRFFTETGYGQGGSVKMTVAANGNVGIGTTAPTHKLAVNGTIRAKEIIVDNTNWADYVFADDYALASLNQVEQHIKENKHLPGIPSAAEVAEKGLNMGEMQALMLSKIEELTLHLIEQNKRLERLEQENRVLRGQSTYR